MPPPKRKPPTAMLYGEAARTTLLRGMEQMTRLLRPTLGPVARTVAVASLLNGQPEILDDGATIARRTIELSDPFESIGAMIVRHVAWRVHETVGDGATTAAVIATRLMAEAVRVIAAGASPVGVRRGIEQAMEVARAELQAQARPIELPEEIARIVLGTVRDEKIAEMIGEIVEGVGEDGAVLVENAHGIETSYQYLEGIYWDEGWHSPSFLREHEATVRLIDPRILITDQADRAARRAGADPGRLRPGRRALADGDRARDQRRRALAAARQPRARHPGVGRRQGALARRSARRHPGGYRRQHWRALLPPRGRRVDRHRHGGRSRHAPARPGPGRARSASWAGTAAARRSGPGSSRRVPSLPPSKTTIGCASAFRSGSASSRGRR